jgi:hypothetical protein
MLTLAEEVLLLLHDEQRGRFFDVPDMLLHTALAGSALMELALLGRIDTDLAELTLIDAASRQNRVATARPTGSTSSVLRARRSGPPPSSA